MARPAQPQSGEMHENPTMEEGQMQEDVWGGIPKVDQIPFLTSMERADLVNSGAIVKITAMDYEREGQYGPKFVATFIHPDGDERLMSMTTNKGKTQRDVINKAIWQLFRDGRVMPVEARLVKRGNAYYLDKPGSESDRALGGTTPNGTPPRHSEPDF